MTEFSRTSALKKHNGYSTNYLLVNMKSKSDTSLKTPFRAS